MGLKFVLLSLALVASGLRFSLVAGESVDLQPDGDPVQQSINLISNGTVGSTRIMQAVKFAVKIADNAIKEAEKRMEQLTEKIGTLGVVSNNITKEVFEKYDNSKKEMRGARRKLRS